MGPTTAVLELSTEQRELVLATSGLVLERLSLDATQLTAMALAAEAASRGRRLRRVDQPIALELTPEQRTTCRVVGVDVRMVLLDPDGLGVRFHEQWSAGDEAVLSPALRVTQRPGSPEPGVVRLVAPEDGVGVFGTGCHATTAMMAGLLESVLRPGDVVLDLGTGSGVLAVAACRLGAARADGVDVVPAAVEAARRAAVLNGLEDRVHIRLAPVEETAGEYDVVLANLLPSVLLRQSDAIAARMRPTGHLLLSGIVTARAESVLAAYERRGLAVLGRLASGRWAAAHLVRAPLHQGAEVLPPRSGQPTPTTEGPAHA